MVSLKPRITVIHNFLTDAEADRLVEVARPMVRSLPRHVAYIWSSVSSEQHSREATAGVSCTIVHHLFRCSPRQRRPRSWHAATLWGPVHGANSWH